MRSPQALLGVCHGAIVRQVLKMTSAVTMSVAGNAKLVVLIGISMAMFERAPTVFTIVGLVIGLSECGWYS